MPTGIYEHHNQKDMTGMIIGYTRVDGFNHRVYGGNSFWNCTCLYNGCGNRFVRSRTALIRHKEDANCGCYSRKKYKKAHYDHFKNIGIKSLPHGRRISEILHGMKQRCGNPNSKSYQHYGARGIRICEEWLNDSRAFYEWAISNGYDDNLSIDRIDSNGDYEPSNCRWCTYEEQNNNKSSTKKYRYENGEYTVSELARLTGTNESTLRARIKRGLSVENAIQKNRGNYNRGGR